MLKMFSFLSFQLLLMLASAREALGSTVACPSTSPFTNCLECADSIVGAYCVCNTNQFAIAGICVKPYYPCSSEYGVSLENLVNGSQYFDLWTSHIGSFWDQKFTQARTAVPDPNPVP